MSKVSDYIQLMRAAVDGHLTLVQFSESYIAMFKAEETLYPEQIFETLNNVFLDSDEFEPSDSALYEELKRNSPGFTIGDEEYRARIEAAFKVLSGIASL
jgi:hypothetical protein